MAKCITKAGAQKGGYFTEIHWPLYEGIKVLEGMLTLERDLFACCRISRKFQSQGGNGELGDEIAKMITRYSEREYKSVAIINETVEKLRRLSNEGRVSFVSEFDEMYSRFESYLEVLKEEYFADVDMLSYDAVRKLRNIKKLGLDLHLFYETLIESVKKNDEKNEAMCRELSEIIEKYSASEYQDVALISRIIEDVKKSLNHGCVSVRDYLEAYSDFNLSASKILECFRFYKVPIYN